MDPITVLTSLLPFAIHAGKQVLNHFLGTKGGGVPPIGDMKDYVSYNEQRIDLFNAMKDAGGDEPTYLWVAAVKQLIRPLIALIVFAGWIYVHVYHGNVNIPVSTVDNMASIIGFYLFGDRTLFATLKRTG